MIVRKQCPQCSKQAELVAQDTLSCGLISRKYACGHVETSRQLRSSDFNNFISLDGHRPYDFQKEGAVFAAETAGGRFLIMDEMGLGKTVQALMVIKSHERDLCPFLVLCKSGLKMQWLREIHRWCGEDWIAQVISGESDFILPGVKGYILSFDMLWRFKDIDAWIKRAGIKIVIIDEVQHIKNTDSKRTNGVRKVCANISFVGGLSGTPVKNNADEFFPILNLIRPDKFPRKDNFQMRWVNTYWDGYKMKSGGFKNAKLFREYTKDFIIRRTREEVLPQLPQITRDFRFSELGDVVEDAYKQCIKEYQQYYNYGGIADSASVRNANILAYLTKMRHLTGIAKIEPVCDYVADFMEETDRKIVIFLHHKDVAFTVLSKLRSAREAGWGKDILSLSADLDSAGRQDVVDRFASPDYRIMIASTLASGEGLNLQFCSDSILMERQWNPANEEQAIVGRFIRIGQQSSKVTATYFIAVGTVDEFLTKLVEQKYGMMSNVLDGKEVAWDESSIMHELAEVIALNGGKKWGW